MGIDIRQLSPSAQKQVLQKLAESQQSRAESTLKRNEDKLSASDKSAQNASKYGNKKVEVNGILFDSKREARRYLELNALEKAGEIQDLQLQVKFLLIPSQRIDGKVVEREVTYKADFVYKKNGETIVEDSKGHRTKDYILRRKLMLHVHGVRIREV